LPSRTVLPCASLSFTSNPYTATRGTRTSGESTRGLCLSPVSSLLLFPTHIYRTQPRSRNYITMSSPTGLICPEQVMWTATRVVGRLLVLAPYSLRRLVRSECHALICRVLLSGLSRGDPKGNLAPVEQHPLQITRSPECRQRSSISYAGLQSCPNSRHIRSKTSAATTSLLCHLYT
jgi:hypothetical protein